MLPSGAPRCSVEKMDVTQKRGDENADPEQEDHGSGDAAGAGGWTANTREGRSEPGQNLNQDRT